MATVLTPADQRVVLYDIAWETYERLLADLENSSAPHLAYDQGILEIMSPLPEHEEANRTIAQLVEIIAEEWNVDIRNLGSTTFKREDLERGFEPDSCFYVQNVERIRGKRRFDLTIDPPPDLVIEIDITHPSLPRLPIYAQLGVPEVWRYDGRTVRILVLEEGTYREQDQSRALPSLSATVLTSFLEESQTLGRPAWIRRVREWAREERRRDNNRG